MIGVASLISALSSLVIYVIVRLYAHNNISLHSCMYFHDCPGRVALALAAAQGVSIALSAPINAFNVESSCLKLAFFLTLQSNEIACV